MAGRLESAEIFHHSTHELAALLEVSMSLAETLDIDRTLQAAVDGVTSLVGLDTAAIYLLEGRMLRLGATTPPLPPGFPEQLRRGQLAEHPHLASAISGGAPLLVPDFPAEQLSAAERTVAEQRNLRTVLFVPIVADALTVGVFIVGSCNAPAPIEEAKVALSRALANLAALAIRNAQLYKERQEYAIRLKRTLAERTRAEQEQVSLRAQLAHAQKLDSVGRLAGGIAHDLNNLLSPILGYGDLLLEDLDPRDTRREFIDEILSAGTRARDLVGQLLAFGRKQTLHRKPTDLDAAVAGLERLLRRTIPEDINVVIKPAEAPRTVMADVGQLDRVIINMAVNAVDAMPQGGQLTFGTALVDLDAAGAAGLRLEPGEYVALTISDTGCGMDDEIHEHLFEPFFSTKGDRGTGLGLATAYGIVRQHGGTIRVESQPGEGARFTIYLPVCSGERVEQREGAAAAADLRGSETIMLVEDDEQVRTLAKTLLARQGYAVLVAASSAEALQILADHSGPVHLLLTDVVMPEMNGKELFARAVELRPELKVLYMTGYAADVVAHRGVLEAEHGYIQKPFTIQGFATKVRDALGRG